MSGRILRRTEYGVNKVSENWNIGPPYETQTLSVRLVPSIPDTRFGVHFKDTNEFAVYSFWRSDEGKVYEDIMRSDTDFEGRRSLLDAIRGDEPIRFASRLATRPRPS